MTLYMVSKEWMKATGVSLVSILSHSFFLEARIILALVIKLFKSISCAKWFICLTSTHKMSTFKLLVITDEVLGSWCCVARPIEDDTHIYTTTHKLLMLKVIRTWSWHFIAVCDVSIVYCRLQSWISTGDFFDVSAKWSDNSCVWKEKTINGSEPCFHVLPKHIETLLGCWVILSKNRCSAVKIGLEYGFHTLVPCGNTFVCPELLKNKCYGIM